MRQIVAASKALLLKSLRLIPMETVNGFDHPEVVETIYRKTVNYRASEPWPEMEGARTVLDFGGGCGFHYKQANNPDVRWAVVETPPMVARARSLETDRLKFFTEIDDAASWLGQIDVMHSNGAVQYAPEPLATIRKLCALGAERMLWYRVFLGDRSDIQIGLLKHVGPGPLPVARKKVALARSPVPEHDFLQAHADYNLIEQGEDWFKFNLSCARRSTSQRSCRYD
jgi:putative methyltransferase (TIGR04325 family)